MVNHFVLFNVFFYHLSFPLVCSILLHYKVLPSFSSRKLMHHEWLQLFRCLFLR